MGARQGIGRRLRTAAWGTAAVAALALLVGQVPAQAAPGDPVGRLDSWSLRAGTNPTLDYASASTYSVFGWAADPDRPGGPVDVHVYVGGTFRAVVSTGLGRPDVQGALPFAGPTSGWSVGGIGPGARVCAYAIDVAGTTNTTLGCTTTPNGDDEGAPGNPLGALDEVSAAPGLLRLRGWAGDDGTSPTPVRVYVDGRWALDLVTGQPRPDVGAVYRRYGGATGWSAELPARPGTSRVCVYALNTGPTGGGNPTLGCRVVGVPGPTAGAGEVRGSLDEATTAAGPQQAVLRRGWAFDASAPGQPVVVRVRSLSTSFSGAALTVETTTTGEARPDVAAAFPQAGPASGYRLESTAGSQAVAYSVVCAYGTEVDQPGVERLLGCRP